MKPALSRIAIVLLFAFLISCGGEKMIRITVTNPGKTERNNQPVVLQKIQLQATYPDIKLEMLQAVGEDGQPVLTQADDLDGDGEADELVLLADFQAGETRIFMLNSVTEKPAIGTAHTYAANWKRIPGSDSFESVDDDAICALSGRRRNAQPL